MVDHQLPDLSAYFKGNSIFTAPFWADSQFQPAKEEI